MKLIWLTDKAVVWLALEDTKFSVDVAFQKILNALLCHDWSMSFENAVWLSLSLRFSKMGKKSYSFDKSWKKSRFQKLQEDLKCMGTVCPVKLIIFLHYSY